MDHEFNVNFGAAIVEITLLFPLSRNVYMSLFAASACGNRPSLSTLNLNKTEKLL